MISINGKNITMTRGDTLKIKFALSDIDGESYTPASGDVIKFGVKENYSDEQCIIEKTIPNDTQILHLQPSDTKSLDFGAYVYDCQITFANGDVNTFIAKGKLRITEEVV